MIDIAVQFDDCGHVWRLNREGAGGGGCAPDIQEVAGRTEARGHRRIDGFLDAVDEQALAGSADTRHAFLLGLTAGVVYFTGTLYWITLVMAVYGGLSMWIAAILNAALIA